jgi:NADH:ubiquinone oxidoreductase subunit F (NADH-binding)/NADH:ubiquinone oxidoreductase subunit E
MTDHAYSPIFPTLERCQHRHGGYIPEAKLPALAHELGVPLYHLYGVITFFPHFRLTPAPQLDVRVCTDLSCRLRGGDRLLGDCEDAARTRPAGEVTVTPVSCLGRCDGAPALSVNDAPYAALDEAGRGPIVAALRGSRPLPTPAAPRPLPGPLQLDPYPNAKDATGRYGALRELIETNDTAAVVYTLQASGLRGLGGAGFALWDKWVNVVFAPGEPKYVVCNADESEPGTIKDRGILTTAPHLLIEGMVIAGLVIGARHGIVYIRHEYLPELEILENAIEDAKAAGVLGDRVLGSSHAFHLETFTSPGGYICGEESALLEALEGKRAQPRLKPPFPAAHGLWGKPTALNNVETLAHVPAILVRRPEWYKSEGRNGGAGWKFVGVSGHVERPGIFEVRMGTTFRQVIDEQAGGVLRGHTLKAIVPSGASSGVLPASAVDTPIEWNALAKAGTMLGSSAIVVIGSGTCMVDVALNIARFFARESCGKCWPCRVGSEKIVDLLDAAVHFEASGEAFEVIPDLEQVLRITSICGLGQVVPNPLASVMKYFPDEVDAHVKGRRCLENACPRP